MGIPQINESQVEAMESLCVGLDAFTMVVPEEALDGTILYNAAMEQVRDLEQLVILGLIKDITKDQSYKVAQMFAQTKNAWRAYIRSLRLVELCSKAIRN